ncbi:MAG: sugar phosphate isomerase/epimerase [Candidatus Bathyarchaeota archaeon]|nr:MAG: sugar phosphate isomerase/epimerase [Candidatus Bathyarchaeota archaeon]
MVKIDIGLSMLHCLGEPFSSLCKRLQHASVSHIELVDDGLHTLGPERVRTLKEISETQDLTFTLHAPFASINIAAQSQETRDFFLRRLEKSMSFAHLLNCRLMVFHPGWRTGISSFYPGLDWKTNIESVQQLLKLSKKYEVNLLLENCPEPYGFLVKNVEQFSRFFNELGEEIKLTLDVGHSNINGQTRKFITRFGKKIAHIHVHDNDGKNDLHLGVGHGTVNWQQFAKDIKKIDYRGIVSIESFNDVQESIEKLDKLLT